MKILGTGLSGLVGGRIVEVLQDRYEFENLSLETGVDITKPGVVDEYVSKSEAPWVWHFAARTDVDGIEAEKVQGEHSLTWTVNVKATEHIVEACKKYGKRLLYLSTDFVFDGTHPTYTEDDKPNPQSWYAQTKYEGEQRVLSLGDHGLVVRIANPYRTPWSGKPDFIQRIVARLEAKQPVNVPAGQLFIPTFIDDIAMAIDALMTHTGNGIYHAVGSEALTPLAVVEALTVAYKITQADISQVPFTQYFAGRAPRPFQAVLSNAKITKLGLHMSTFSEGLRKIRV